MVHDQSLLRQADLAVAVSREDRFAVPAEETPRMPAPVVTPSAESARHERGTAAGPAPPGGLRHLPAPGWFSGGSLPCPATPDRTRIHSSGKPFATQASNRVRSSQAESRSPTAGRTQIPGPSSSKAEDSIRSASSGRWFYAGSRSRPAGRRRPGRKRERGCGRGA